MTRWFAIALLLAGCAAQQTVTLLPRGAGGERGTGMLDRMSKEITVSLNGRDYRGPMVVQTAYSSGYGLFSQRTTISSQATALLLGDDGQVRCEFGFDAFMTMATGVCVDSKNVTYDMLIKN